MFVVLSRPQRIRSHHDATQRRRWTDVTALNDALVSATCCLRHRQWRQSTSSSLCSASYPPTDLRCLSCSIHDPWKWVHENIQKRETTSFCASCGLPLFKYCILDCLVVSVILPCSCIFEQCAYVILMDSTPSRNLRLDSKQLVSEFLQGALSAKMRSWFGPGWRCFYLTTCLMIWSFGITDLPTTKRTRLYLSITARF